MPRRYDTPDTSRFAYADRLRRLEFARWKQALDVQAPYRRHIQRMALGKTLDVGCGIGRNLAYLSRDSVGVDHNATAVEIARRRGLTALNVTEYEANAARYAGVFDSMLAAHLIEHLAHGQAVDVIRAYLPALRPRARVVFICPQEMGFRTDSSHVAFSDFETLRRIAEDLGLTVELQYSFPFARPAGRLFAYNEFVQIARVP